MGNCKSDVDQEGVRQRKGDKLASEEEEGDKESKQVKKKSLNKDPLRWFGFMPPASLRRAQAHFVKALELTVEVANLQSELGGVQARLKFLRRIKTKAVVEEKEDVETKDVIENIDSSFAAKLSLNE